MRTAKDLYIKYYAEKYGATIIKENGYTVAIFNQEKAGQRLKAFEDFFEAISHYTDARSGLYDGKIALYL